MTTKAASDFVSDREWFACHSGENQRVRAPNPGEVGQIMMADDPRLSADMAAYTADLTTAGGFDWRVRVVKVGRHCWRDLLVHREATTGETSPDIWHLNTLTIGTHAAVAKL